MNVYNYRGCFCRVLLGLAFLLMVAPFAAGANVADEHYSRAQSFKDPLQKWVWLNKAIKFNESSEWPLLHQAYYERAELYASWGLYEEALRDLDQALYLFPAMFKAHYLKADIYRMQEQWSLLVDSLTEGLKFSKKPRPDFYFQRGMAYFSQNMFEEAAYDFYESIKRKEQVQVSLHKRALSQVMLFQYEAAVDTLNVLVKEYEEPYYQFLRGSVFYLLYRERELDLLKSHYGLSYIYEDKQLNVLNQYAAQDLLQSYRRGYRIGSKPDDWNGITRLRSYMPEFLDFYELNIFESA